MKIFKKIFVLMLGILTLFSISNFKPRAAELDDETYLSDVSDTIWTFNTTNIDTDPYEACNAYGILFSTNEPEKPQYCSIQFEIPYLYYMSMEGDRVIAATLSGTGLKFTSEEFRTIYISGGADVSQESFINWIYKDASLILSDNDDLDQTYWIIDDELDMDIMESGLNSTVSFYTVTNNVKTLRSCLTIMPGYINFGDEEVYTTKDYWLNESLRTIYIMDHNDLTIGKIGSFAVYKGTYNEETYSIKFMKDDSVYYSTTKKLGDEINLNTISSPSKTGYTFSHWEDTDGNKYENILVVSGNLTLYSIWNKNSYSVKMYVDNKLTYNETHLYGSTLNLTTNQLIPEKDGYIFSHWVDSNGKKVTLLTVTKDTNLYAIFVENQPESTYKLDLYVDGVIVNSIERVQGSVISLSSYVPEKPGYDFACWVDEDNNIYTSFTFTESKKLFALFDPIKSEAFATIIYNSDSFGTDKFQIRIPLNTSGLKVSQNTFAIEGYKFTGWNTESDGSGINIAVNKTIFLESESSLLIGGSNGIRIELLEDMSLNLYAIWEPTADNDFDDSILDNPVEEESNDFFDDLFKFDEPKDFIILFMLIAAVGVLINIFRRK